MTVVDDNDDWRARGSHSLVTKKQRRRLRALGGDTDGSGRVAFYIYNNNMRIRFYVTESRKQITVVSGDHNNRYTVGNITDQSMFLRGQPRIAVLSLVVYAYPLVKRCQRWLLMQYKNMTGYQRCVMGRLEQQGNDKR